MVAGAFVGVLFVATFIEWVTERFFGSWLKGAYILLIAATLAVVACLAIPIEGLSMVGIATNPWVDRVITGIIAGGGANAVHMFLGKYLK